MAYHFIFFPFFILATVSLGVCLLGLLSRVLLFQHIHIRLTNDFGIQGLTGLFFLGLSGIVFNFFIPLSSSVFFAVTLICILVGSILFIKEKLYSFLS